MIKIKKTIYVLTVSSVLVSLSFGRTLNVETIASPNGKYRIEFSSEEKGNSLTYSVFYNNIRIVIPSRMGFLLEDSTVLGRNLNIKSVKKKTVQQSWKSLYGERNEYPEHYNESNVTMVSSETGKEDNHVKTNHCCTHYSQIGQD